MPDNHPSLVFIACLYGDFTHQWPPVGEMFYYYLSKTWRKDNAPTDNDKEWSPEGYECDFEATWGYGMRQDLMVRNQEYQNFALSNYKEAAMDLHCLCDRKEVTWRYQWRISIRPVPA